jgi:multidrug resistance efflux pump
MTWKLCVGGVVALLALATGLQFYWPFGGAANVLTLPGVVEIQEVRLGSKIGGRVADVFVTEGNLLEPGQELVRVETPELDAQKRQAQARVAEMKATLLKAKNGPRPEEIAAAKAAMQAAQARLERLQAGYRLQEIDQARGDSETADAELKLAKEDFTRTERLFQTSGAARAEYDLARANLERSRGRSVSAKAKLEMVLEGSRKEDIAEGVAEQRRTEANYQLLLAGTRPEEIAEAEARVGEEEARLAEIEANLKEALVRAPEKAIVEVVAVRKGDLLTPNQPMLRVLRTRDLWVKVYVPETQLGKVRLNQQVEVTVDSYPGRRLQGVVDQIANASEFTPRNVQSVDERQHQVFGVRVRVADPQGIFKSGMAADVHLPLQD